MKKVAILQSNYIPWKGYFDLIAAVDEFIFYDEMQYSKGDWRNRNKIKTPQGVQWLTIPVRVKGKHLQKIREVEIDGTSWAKAHWKTIELNYSRASHFAEVAEWLAPHYLTSTPPTYLSELNRNLIESVCRYLGIHTKISCSSAYRLLEEKSERVADLCLQANGTEYISGPAAKDYLNPLVFDDRGIQLTWFGYEGYPEYPQLWGAFEHRVSILDLLFNCGKTAPAYMQHKLPL